MNMFKPLFVAIFCIILILFSLFIGCKKNEDNTPPAPDLLPMTTMVMNFEDFPDAYDSLVNAHPDRFENWGHADSMVNIWKQIASEDMLLPITVYSEAFNHQATYDSENSNWTWQYSRLVVLPEGSYPINAELTAAYQGENVIWELHLSTQNNYYDNFLLFSGKSTKDQLGGWWLVYENPENPEESIRVEWVEPGNDQRGILYKIVKDQSPEKNSYIAYGEVSGEFDRYYNIYTMRQDNNSEIDWNNAGQHGRVHDSWHFEDIDWHCWDTDQQDADCR